MAASVIPSCASVLRKQPRSGFKVSSLNGLFLTPCSRFALTVGRGFTRLNAAGFSEIEPDLLEDKRDPWATNGVSEEDFLYGEYDGHHTYYEGNEGSFWEGLVADYQAGEPPTGFQGAISWLFLPAVIAAMAYNVPGEYIYIGAAVFVVVFCAMEMVKPDQPHNFEPQIYNMDREVRDKMIADYNTMDIWDFNEKYGELWDFTVKNEEMFKNK